MPGIELHADFDRDGRITRSARERSARLVAVNAPETARRVIYTTGLDEIVSIADDDAAGVGYSQALAGAHAHLRLLW